MHKIECKQAFHFAWAAATVDLHEDLSSSANRLWQASALSLSTVPSLSAITKQSFANEELAVRSMLNTDLLRMLLHSGSLGALRAVGLHLCLPTLLFKVALQTRSFVLGRFCTTMSAAQIKRGLVVCGGCGAGARKRNFLWSTMTPAGEDNERCQQA